MIFIYKNKLNNIWSSEIQSAEILWSWSPEKILAHLFVMKA
jgi:hypothetical protein